MKKNQIRKSVAALAMAAVVSVSLLGYGCGSKPASSTAGVSGEFTGTAKGMGGDVTVTLTLTDGKITGCTAEGKDETPGIGTMALEQLPGAIAESGSIAVDGVATATITSDAIKEAAAAALVAAGLNADDYKTEVKAEENKAEDSTIDADIAIVGAGGAGMTAAITAAAEGKSVVILESQPMVGGNSVRATGGMNAGDTVYQDENEFGESAGVEKTLKTAAEKYADNATITALAKTVSEQWAAYQADPKGYFDSVELMELDTMIGGFDPFIQGDYSHLGLDIPLWVYIVFQTVFCATAATIVSGSMAERTNFKAYCVYSAAISLVVYPICGHWMWGGGWLQSMGFHDFAGSAAVHNVGGVIALLGAWMLGPRIGKYDKNGKPHAIPGHNLTAGALGVFILWFCWFGFNGGSSLSLATDEAMTMTGLVCFNTNLAAAVATCVTMIFTWLRYGKPDVSMTLNGSLAGLVAITAGCDTVSPFGAFFIGFVAGLLVVLSVEFFDNIAKVDDPVGAVSVHFANGVWGTIAVGLFSTGANTEHAGLFYGGGLAQLGTQLLGLVTVDIYVVVVMFIIFKLIDKFIGLRVPAEVEIDGLDIHEHGLASAYAGFSISDANSAAMVPNENTDLGEDDVTKATDKQISAAVPVVREPSPVIHDGVYDTGMHKVSIIAKLSKFDQLKTALNDLGVTGMTVTQVMGCGIQKGTSEKYRGVPVDTTLLPKIKVEVIVSKISVDAVVEAAKKALYTGHIGDGKIFVYNVTRVVKIRTGEEDFAALQDVE